MPSSPVGLPDSPLSKSAGSANAGTAAVQGPEPATSIGRQQVLWLAQLLCFSMLPDLLKARRPQSCTYCMTG